MNPALSFGKRVIAQQAILTVLGFAALAAFVPPVLRLEDSLVGEVAIRVTAIGLLAAATVGAAVGVRLGRLRFTLRALALGSRAVETHEVDALSRVPQRALRVKWAVEPSRSARSCSRCHETSGPASPRSCCCSAR